MIEKLNEIIVTRFPEKSFSLHVSGDEFTLTGIDLNTNEYNEIKNEWQNQIPISLLRSERNRKLTETDWWCCSDRTPTQAQLNYRQALRDLPKNASPSLDENGNLTGVTWPTKPE